MPLYIYILKKKEKRLEGERKGRGMGPILFFMLLQ
jgi:hypothetical protein